MNGSDKLQVSSFKFQVSSFKLKGALAAVNLKL